MARAHQGMDLFILWHSSLHFLCTLIMNTLLSIHSRVFHLVRRFVSLSLPLLCFLLFCNFPLSYSSRLTSAQAFDVKEAMVEPMDAGEKEKETTHVAKRARNA